MSLCSMPVEFCQFLLVIYTFTLAFTELRFEYSSLKVCSASLCPMADRIRLTDTDCDRSFY